MNKPASSPGLYPIQAAARRSGVNVELLRAWERRYGVVQPARSDGGQRLYSDDDVARLALLRRAVEGGLRIKDAASRSDDELRSFVATSGVAAVAAPAAAAPGDAGKAALLEACQAAVQAQDNGALEQALDRARVALSVPELIDDVVGPLAAWIGEAWSEGQLRIYQEHGATLVLRDLLASILRSTRGGIATMVSTTPSGETHELGAMLAAVGAAAAGWRAEFLGADLPAAEIAAAAARHAARAVSLSVVVVESSVRLGEELRLLKRLLGPDVAILVGGRAAGEVEGVLREIDARQVTSVAQLVRILASLPG